MHKSELPIPSDLFGIRYDIWEYEEEGDTANHIQRECAGGDLPCIPLCKSVCPIVEKSLVPIFFQKAMITVWIPQTVLSTGRGLRYVQCC